jgi:hypothetical protein
MVEATDADREEHAAVDDQAAAPGSADRPSGWLTVVDAARATAWHPERLRSLARRGMVVSRRGNRGLEILVEHGLPRPTGDQLRPRGRPTAADGDGAEPAILREQVERLRATVDALRDELAEAAARAAGLRVDLTKALAEREAARAVAVADVTAAKLVAEAEIAAKDVLVAELRALLAEARRPWWRRLLAS